VGVGWKVHGRSCAASATRPATGWCTRCAGTPLFAAFALAYIDRKAIPTLEPVPGIDLDEYKHNLIECSSNAGVRDTVARLCAENSQLLRGRG
jgi:mannitol-1-phosphate/altronate dehydrogenase